MIDFKRVRTWRRISQIQMAEIAGINQGAYSKVESGTASASTRLIEAITNHCTPTVLFLTGDNALLVAHAMRAAGQITAICADTSALDATLRTGAHIAVVGCDIAECRLIIDAAKAESGLFIPVRGIDIGEDRITSF